MRELEVVGVRIEMPSRTPIVLLREREGGRYLPIWIGSAEANAISLAQQGIVPPRPLTHDLFTDVVAAFGHKLEQVRIIDVRDNVFYAELGFDTSITVPARSSDAIALALRVGCPILGADQVLESSSVPPPDEDIADDDEVERFREFLDHVSAEDFEGPAEGSGESGETGPTPHS